MDMPRRRIGTSGPEVSVLAMGSWHTYDRMDFHDAVELVRAGVDAGITLFDVGVYGGVPVASDGGRIHYYFTDVLFGRMVERAGIARSRYVLSVKLWLEEFPGMSLAEQLDRALFRVADDHAEFAVLGDIRNDDMDMHAAVMQLAELVRSGKLGAWGVNNWSVADIRRAYDIARRESVPGPQLAQLKYSLCRRADAEADEYLRLFSETGISLQASDIFEGGILAGKPRPHRMIGHDPGGVQDRMRAELGAITALAAEFDATPAQLGIAFCLGHPALATVLFGVTSIEQLRANIAGLDLYRRRGDEIRARANDLWSDLKAG